MTNIKRELEQAFLDHWTFTPVQFDTTDFKAPNDKQWIAPQFIPIDRHIYAFDGAKGRKVDRMQVKILCYSNSPTKVLMLEDKVKEFLECHDLQTVDAWIDVGVPDGLGIIPLDNGTYNSALTFAVKAYH